MSKTVNMRGRRGRIIAVLLAAVLGTTVAAWAYWSQPSKGSASGHVGNLGAPTISSATPGGGAVALSWTAVTAPAGGTVQYYVSRDGGAAGSECPSAASPGTQTNCTDTGVSIGKHSYTVTAVWRSWTGKSASASAQVTTGPATHLLLAPATATPTAGAADNLTITAQDASNNTVTAYSGAKTLTFGGAGNAASAQPTVTNAGGTAVAFGTGETLNFVGGVATVSGSGNGVMTLYKAETAKITVSDGTLSNGSGTSVTVGAASASSFTVPTPSAQTAGKQFNETLTALDQYGNTASNYTGVKSITFSGPASSPNGKAPSYPASVTFNAGVSTAFGITLDNAASTTLTAKEGSTVSGSSASFLVNPATAKVFTLAPLSAQTVNVPFDVQLTANDEFANTATGYKGSTAIAFSGPANGPNGKAPTYPTTVNFTAGIGTAKEIALYDVQSTAITAKDNALSVSGTSAAFAVGAGAAASFAVATPATQTAGTAFTTTLTAKDAGGNTATGYAGSAAIAFSGPESSASGESPKYPAAVSFTAGVGTANGITLYDAGSTSLTAKEGSSIGGTSGTFTVNGLTTTSKFLLSTPAPTVGSAFSETILATDTYGNTTTSYTGSHTLGFSGPASGPNGKAPSYPSSVSFTSGEGKASIILYDAQTTTLTVKQTSPTAITATSANFTIVAGPAASFTVPTPSSQTAGTAFNETLTALDAGGNTATGYAGSMAVAFSGPETSASGETPKYPASVSFSAGVGTASGITLYDQTSGTQLEAVQGSVKGTSGAFAVNAGVPAKLAWTGATSSFGSAEGLCLFTCSWNAIGRGHTWSAKVSVTDASGNVVSNVGAGHTVIWTAGPSQGSVSPSAGLSLPSSGAATTASLTYTSSGSNGWTQDAFTARSTGYADATVTFKK